MSVLEFSDVVKRIVEQYVKTHIYTSIPAKIINVDNFQSQQVIDVQPQINDSFKDGKVLELPPILDVPVQFPAGGGALASFPLKVGDVVLVTFSMKSIDEWLDSRAEDKTFTPADKRSYHLNDAIAIPCLYTRNTTLNPNPTDVEIKFGTLSFRLTPDNQAILTNGTASATINSSNEIVFQTAAGTLTYKANGELLHYSGAKLTASGDFVTASGISLDNHVHSGSPTAPTGPVSNTGAPV